MLAILAIVLAVVEHQTIIPVNIIAAATLFILLLARCISERVGRQQQLRRQLPAEWVTGIGTGFLIL
jgi:hypothetical protein